MECIIDLNEHNNSKKEILHLRYTRNTRKVLRFFAERNPAYICHRMELQLKSAPSYVASNFESLFSISLPQYTEVPPSLEVNGLKVDKKDLDVSILMDPRALYIPAAHNEEHQLTNQKVALELLFQPSEKEAPSPTEVALELTILKEQAYLKPHVTLHEDIITPFLYEPNMMDLGSLSCRNAPSQEFAYRLSLKDIEIILEDEQGLQYMNVIKIDMDSSYTNSEEAWDEGKTEQGVYSKNIRPFEERLMRLKIDLRKVKNPKGQCTYSVHLKGKRQLKGGNYEEFEEKNLCKFLLEENKRDTALFATYYHGNKEKSIDLTSAQIISLPDQVYDLQNDSESKGAILIEGRVGNQASVKNEDGSVLLIKNISFDIICDQEVNPFGKGEVVHRYFDFKIREKNNGKWTSGKKRTDTIILENEPNAYFTYRCEIKNENFSTLPKNKENKMALKAIVTYEYGTKNRFSNDEAYKTVSHRFSFSLRQTPGTKWLGIDFGTSAIVAEYGNGDGDSISLALQEQHKDIYKDRPQDYNELYIEEYGTAFLSSTLLLERFDVLAKKVTERSNLSDAVSLSPSIHRIRDDHFRLVPFLKALIGFDKLPDIYQKQLIRYHKASEDYRNISISNILISAYDNLLNQYIKPLIEKDGKSKEMNKVILTVPNTFTYGHRAMLTRTVKSVFNGIWDNYIKFISESDAVACYYKSNYAHLLRSHWDNKKGDIDRLLKDRKENGDTVLVYDMGAGTLDLTIFQRTPDKNNKVRITMLGKVGIATAGNYLDTTLAAITFEVIRQIEGYAVLEDFHPVYKYDGFIDAVLLYKRFIKEAVKPALSADMAVGNMPTVVFPGSGDREVTISDIDLDKIRKAPLFQEFLHKITRDALILLKNNLSVDPSKLKIKTLMITGRGGQLYGLKEMLQEALKRIFQHDGNPMVVVPDEQLMKSIVVKGALNYAHYEASKKESEIQLLDIPARFGCLISDIDGVQYHELLNPSSKKPFTHDHDFEQRIRKKGIVLEKDVLLNNVKEIVVIQTFLYKKEDVVRQYEDRTKSNFYDSSAVIQRFQHGVDFDSGEGTISMLYCEDGEIEVRLLADLKMIYDPKRAKSIDIQNSRSFRWGMWPVIPPTNPN